MTQAGREKTGTFLVTHVDAGGAVLRDVGDGEVHTLDETRDLAAGELLEATLAAGPMGVVWSIRAVETRRTIPVERSPESPTAQAIDIADDQAVGEVTTRERAGDGELHVLTVPPGETETAVDDVIADEGTVARAARLGVDRVEVRAEDGIVSVRYLPG